MIEVKELFDIDELSIILADPELRLKMTSVKQDCEKEFEPDFERRRYLGFYDDNQLYGVVWFTASTNICAEFHACFMPKQENEGKRILKTYRKFEEWMIQNTKYLKITTSIPSKTCSKVIYCAIECGMEYEGLLKQHIFFHEQLQDSAILSKNLDRGF